MPKVMTAGARPSRLRAGPPEDRDALGPIVAESRKAAVQPGRGPDLREPRVQPGRGPDLRGDLDAEAAEPRTRNRLRPGPPKDREAEDTRLQFGPVAQPAAELEPARPESVGQRKNFQAASQEFARFLRQNSEAFAQAVEALGDSDASGFAQAWLEDYDRRAEEALNLVAPELRPLLSTDFEAHRAEYYNEAYAVERDRGILAIRRGITSTRQEYLELVGQEPARLDYAFQKMEEMIRASGLRPDLIEEEMLAARRAIFKSYRQARLAGPNPEALLREMEAGRFEGIVPPEELAALVVQTTAEVGQRQRAALMERQVDADTRQRFELQRLRAGEDGDPHITPDTLREIFPGEVGERKARQLESERRRAEVRAQTALMTPAEIEAAFGVFESGSGTREAPDETLASSQGDETLAGGATSDRLQVGEGADTRADEASGAELDTNRQESDESAAAGQQRANPEKGPEEHGINDNRVSLESDPVGHIMKLPGRCSEAALAAEQATGFSEQVRLNEHAIDLCLEMQKALKGTSEGSRVLSNEIVTATLAELEALPMLQRVDRLWNFMSRQGRHADRSLDELMQAGLPDALGVVAHLWNSGNYPAADDLRQALSKDRSELFAEIGKLFGGDIELGKTVARGIESRVRQRSEEFRSIFHANRQTRESEARLQAAILFALQKFVSQGSGGSAVNADRIARLAVEAIFPFGRLNDHDRVLLSVGRDNGLRPEIDPDKANQLLSAVKRDITASNHSRAVANVFPDVGAVQDKEQIAEQYADNVRTFGFWRNTCDGVQLVDQGGRPVAREDGSLVTVTWEQLQSWQGDSSSFAQQVWGARP